MNDSSTAKNLNDDIDQDRDQDLEQYFDHAPGQGHDQGLAQSPPADQFWSYEVPRPWLSIEEAASMLGRSVRGVERSIIGRWGNKLPEGWQARRVRLDGNDEWRIVPPPGFRVKHSKKMDPA